MPAVGFYPSVHKIFSVSVDVLLCACQHAADIFAERCLCNVTEQRRTGSPEKDQVFGLAVIRALLYSTCLVEVVHILAEIVSS